MGLLEEAIREHLELQRRSGRDLQQIALAEQEALQPLVPGQTPDWAQGPQLFDHEEPLQPGSAPSGGPLVEPAQQMAASSALEQETAELDMSAVMGLGEGAARPQDDQLADQAGVPEFGPVHARRIVAEPPAPESPEPDFEWEIPGVTRPRGASA